MEANRSTRRVTKRDRLFPVPSPELHARSDAHGKSGKSGVCRVPTYKAVEALAGKESGVRCGIVMTRSAIWKYRLASPVRWWYRSTLRILVEEACNFPRRIRAILRSPYIRIGYTLPTYPTFDGMESLGQGYEFACACSEDIKRLHRENQWAGSLDLELPAAAYQAGSDWAIHNFHPGKEKGSIAQWSLRPPDPTDPRSSCDRSSSRISSRTSSKSSRTALRICSMSSCWFRSAAFDQSRRKITSATTPTGINSHEGIRVSLLAPPCFSSFGSNSRALLSRQGSSTGGTAFESTETP